MDQTIQKSKQKISARAHPYEEQENGKKLILFSKGRKKKKKKPVRESNGISGEVLRSVLEIKKHPQWK